MIPLHLPYEPPTDLDDLVDMEGFFRLCKGEKQTKFYECNSNCKECPLYSKPRTREREEIQSGIDILIVGGKPSKDDIPFYNADSHKVGCEFKGRKWYGLRNYIKKNSIINKRVVKYGLTTAVMCYSEKHTTKDYPIDAIRQCGTILKRKIVLCGTKVVLLMGRQACKASPVEELGKITSLDKVRGKIFKQNMGGRDIYFIPTHSVKDINKFPDMWSTVLHDLSKCQDILIKGYKKPLLNNLAENYQYPKTYKEVAAILDPLIDKPKKVVAFDIETTGLDPRASDASVTVFSLAWGSGKAAAIYTHGDLGLTKNLPNEIGSGDTYPLTPLDKIVEFLESSTKKVAHNAQFDIGYIQENWGCEIKSLYADTMLFHYLLDENRSGGEERTLTGEFTLKKLVWDFLPAYGGYEEDGDIAQHFKKGEWEKIPKDKLLKYAAMDSDVTLQIFFKQLRILFDLNLDSSKEQLNRAMKHPLLGKERAIHNLATKFMPRATYGVVHLKTSGMCVNQKYLKKLMNDIPAKMDMVQDHVNNAIGKGISLTKNRDISWIVYEHLGMEVIAKTATGNPKTDAKTLTKLAKKDTTGLVNDIMTYKKLSKLHGTFLTNIKNLTNKKTGRVHPSYLLIGTVTGRLSCMSPNLQQMPKYIYLPDKSKINVKKIFRADKGKIFLYADFSQMEMAVMAAYCCKYGDTSLRKAIIEGLDIHCFIASEVFSIPYSDMFKYTKIPGQELEKYVELRSKAKTVGFAIIYGSTAWGMSYKSGMSIQEAQALIELVFEKFPGIPKFIEASHAEAYKYGYVTSPFGRRRRFPVTQTRKSIDNSSKRKAQNFPIQSGASDICLKAVINLTEEITKLQGKIVVTVHDSLICEVEDNKAMVIKAAELMNEIMVVRPKKEYGFLRGVPLKADVEVGYNWGEMESIQGYLNK